MLPPDELPEPELDPHCIRTRADVTARPPVPATRNRRKICFEVVACSTVAVPKFFVALPESTYASASMAPPGAHVQSVLQPAAQTPRAAPSHCSPAWTMPSPHTGGGQ